MREAGAGDGPVGRDAPHPQTRCVTYQLKLLCATALHPLDACWVKGRFGIRKPTRSIGWTRTGAACGVPVCLWSAQWQNGVYQISPDGKLLRKVEWPGCIVSSVMFGGSNLDVLFVTTTRVGLGEPDPTDENAGALLALHGLGACGLPEPYFSG